MARTPKGTPPSYPNKPHKGQVRITVRLIDGRRHDLLLRPFGSPAFAKSKAPVQTERSSSASWERALIQSMSVGLCIFFRVL